MKRRLWVVPPDADRADHHGWMPSVSIVIPARAAAATIGVTVESALAQSDRHPVEVVLSVPMDDAKTRQALRPFQGRITIVDNPTGTTPAGLNAAIDASSGDIVVRCDAHAVLPDGYVTRVVEILEATGAENVGGVQQAGGEGITQRAIAIAQTTPLGVGDARYRLGGSPGPVDTVYLGAFPRRVLERLGGYDERFLRNQDYELNHRIRREGGTVWFDPALQVSYQVRPTLGALARQYNAYGAGKRVMLRHHPDSLRPRQLAAPVLVVALILSLIFLLTSFWPVALFVPTLYLGVMLIAAVVLTMRRRDAAALLLPIVLPTMHLSWGWGFLTG